MLPPAEGKEHQCPPPPTVSGGKGRSEQERKEKKWVRAVQQGRGESALLPQTSPFLFKSVPTVLRAGEVGINIFRTQYRLRWGEELRTGILVAGSRHTKQRPTRAVNRDV
ncbi:hypothetical protein KIL84_007853 [Mauremys mutica]|uniref:Uncharacterized protein n=1 Tax=Mauremys mutica TaxID=74926 RepID=A0A9D3X463_9SAUR|nr:hypothetical protein KIL84_007853 [Mauremys mutica]